MRRAAMLLCTVLLAGCAKNQETLIVLDVPQWDDSGTCVIDATADAMPFGLLDLQFRTPYLMPAALLNNSGTQRTNNAGVDTNEIQLIDAEVTIDSPQDPKLIEALDTSLLHFTAPLATISIPAGETVGVAVEVLPQGTVNALADAFASEPAGAKVTVRANVVFNGTRTGNDTGKVGRVKARDFSFPINLCSGCLIYCGGCENEAGDPAGCPVQASDYSGGACGNAQDLPIWPTGCEGPSN